MDYPPTQHEALDATFAATGAASGQSGLQSDLSALAWILPDTQAALSAALHEFNGFAAEAIAQHDQPTQADFSQLRQARQQFHQADGALQIVGLQGIEIYNQALEKLWDALESGQLALTPTVQQTVATALQALSEYLDDLMLGQAEAPIKLYLPYQQILQTLRAERIHPADLWFHPLPTLTLPPLEREHLVLNQGGESTGPAAVDEIRTRYEAALLTWLRGAQTGASTTERGPDSALSTLAQCMQEAQQAGQLVARNQLGARNYWHLARQFFETVRRGGVSANVQTKRLAARINLLLKHYAQQGVQVPERLLSDTVFELAFADDATIFDTDLAVELAKIRKSFDLPEHSLFAETPYSRPHYALVPHKHLASARQHVQTIREGWEAFAAGDPNSAPPLIGTFDALQTELQAFGQPDLPRLVRQMGEQTLHLSEQQSIPPAALGIEIATAILFIEQGLQQPWRSAGENAAAKLFGERCGVLTERIQSVAAGQVLPHLPWLDALVQAADSRRTLALVLTELRANLRVVEAHVDAYDRDATQQEGLQTAGRVLQQSAAILNTLNAPQALAAIQAAQVHLTALQKAEASERSPLVAQLADNLGGLHQYLDALQFAPEESKQAVEQSFAFDAASGMLLAQHEAGQVAAPSSQSLLDTVRSMLDSLMAEHQTALHLDGEPAMLPSHLDDELTGLHHALESLQQEATLNDDLTLRNQVNQALSVWPQVQTGSVDALAFMQALFAPALEVAPAVATAQMPATDSEMDTELLEIFLSEAQEVLERVQDQLGLLAAQPHDQDVLTQIRRAFHTLKGSGRMVGLKAFGEVAWSMEQVLNSWLAESRAASADVLNLLHFGHDTLAQWVKELATGQFIQHPYEGIVDAADVVRQGGAFSVPNTDGVAPSSLMPAVEFSEPIAEMNLTQAPLVHDGLEGEQSYETSADVSEKVTESAEAEAEVTHDVPTTTNWAQPTAVAAAVTTLAGAASLLQSDTGAHLLDTSAPTIDTNVIEFPFATPLAKDDDHYKQVGPLRISLALYNVYLQEADTLVTRLATDFAEWRHEARLSPTELALRSAHSLQGSSATVGLEPVRMVAAELEQTLGLLEQNQTPLSHQELDVLSGTVEHCRAMLHQFAAGIWPKEDATLPQLLAACHRLGQRPVGVTPPIATNVSHSADNAGSTFVSAPHQLAQPLTQTNPAAQAYDPDLLGIFLEEAHEIVPQLGASLRQWQQMPAQEAEVQTILRHLHTLKGSARMAGVMPMGQTAHEMESAVEAGLRNHQVNDALFQVLYQGYDQLGEQIDALQRGEVLAEPVDEDEQDTTSAVSPIAAPTVAPEPDSASLSNPVQSSSVPSTVDQMATATQEVLPKQSVAELAASLVPQRTQATIGGAASAQLQAERARAVVRVQAQTLDNLINDAGEVGVSRARLENEVTSLKNYLQELNDNVGRLRGQLREIEIQAESQMQSRLADAAEHHEQFDPLEFDRFTRFQEVTRMMAESVNDVATVQVNMLRGFQNTETDLTAQARLTRTLQQNLMRARMVQFDTVSERLYRVARQAASETGKEVRLLIRGGSVEIDRSVLERMAGPLEHLVRNAVAHGVETAAERIAQGKPAIGELVLEVQQEGNEVVLHFFDDGAGLNFQRIRTRALERHLLKADEEVTDSRLSEMIFAPGFSTADQVTELAGRGVGMDVVRAETVALGGRIGLQSEASKGTRFTIHLPLTTAITQVLLVRAGDRTYALPAGMVDQVTQLKVQALAQAYNNAGVEYNGQHVPLHYFGLLLDEASGIPAGQKYAPVVIVRSGNERVAVHVDAIIGNREVVVKNIGAQLARLEGIAGATVLGNGEIVLIYNPIVLAARYERIAKPAQQAPQEPIGAVAEWDATEVTDVQYAPVGQTVPSTPSRPVPGLKAQATVMVVDDSLTVRKVSQRLLTRAGYQVVLAKDGVDALKQLQTITPNVMLVDIEMPHMDGFDLTRNIRADERISKMPIIMITSRTADKHRLYAQQIGVNEYLGKPFNDEQLLALIERYVAETTA